MKLLTVQFFSSPLSPPLTHPPNISLNTLFSNILSLRSSLNVTDQVSQPYKTAGKIRVLYNSIFIFLDITQEDKIFRT